MRAVGARQRAQNGTSAFALFAECILTGLWFTLAALPLVTVPAALAASSRHLAAFLDGTPSKVADFARDFRLAWRGGWKAGLVFVAAAALLTVDLVVLTVEGVPARAPMALMTLLVAAAALSVLLRAGAAWRPGDRWRPLMSEALAAAKSDLTGTGILLGGLVVLTVATWALWMLFVPMCGCVVGAALAVHRRRAALLEA